MEQWQELRAVLYVNDVGLLVSQPTGDAQSVFAKEQVRCEVGRAQIERAGAQIHGFVKGAQRQWNPPDTWPHAAHFLDGLPGRAWCEHYDLVVSGYAFCEFPHHYGY